MIYQYFRSIYRKETISAHIIPDLTRIDEAWWKRIDLLNRLGYYVELNSKTGERD